MKVQVKVEIGKAGVKYEFSEEEMIHSVEFSIDGDAIGGSWGKPNESVNEFFDRISKVAPDDYGRNQEEITSYKFGLSRLRSMILAI